VPPETKNRRDCRTRPRRVSARSQRFDEGCCCCCCCGGGGKIGKLFGNACAARLSCTPSPLPALSPRFPVTLSFQPSPRTPRRRDHYARAPVSVSARVPSTSPSSPTAPAAFPNGSPSARLAIRVILSYITRAHKAPCCWCVLRLPNTRVYLYNDVVSFRRNLLMSAMTRTEN